MSTFRVLYTGVTNDLERRVFQHRGKAVRGFTQKYDVTRLIYFEAWGDIRELSSARRKSRGGGVKRRSS